MQTWLRLLLTVLATVSAYYFVYWMARALVFGGLPSGTADAAGFATGLVAAVLVGCCAWVQTRPGRTGLFHFIVLGALLTGTAGFVFGFFGPLLFAPGANQGPLLGLFITGPLGFLFGGVGGAVYGLKHRRPAA